MLPYKPGNVTATTKQMTVSIVSCHSDRDFRLSHGVVVDCGLFCEYFLLQMTLKSFKLRKWGPQFVYWIISR